MFTLSTEGLSQRKFIFVSHSVDLVSIGDFACVSWLSSLKDKKQKNINNRRPFLFEQTFLSFRFQASPSQWTCILYFSELHIKFKNLVLSTELRTTKRKLWNLCTVLGQLTYLSNQLINPYFTPQPTQHLSFCII